MYEYFNAIEERHWWFQARKEIVLRLIDQHYEKGKKLEVLDIGCGTGMTLKALEKYGEVWGLDKNIKAIEYSKKKAPEAQVMQGSFPAQVPAKQFDIITVLDVIEHIEEDGRALQKLAQTLKPNGIAVITAPAYKLHWTGHDDMNEHKRRYTAPELKQKLRDAGLEIKKISYYNTLLFFPIAAAKIMSRVFSPHAKSHFTAAPPPAFLNLPLKAIFAFEKYLLPHINFPFGISIIAVATRK